MTKGKFGGCRSAAIMVLFASACSRGPSSPTDTRSENRERAIEELNDSTTVVSRMLESYEIPRGRRERARCVVVVPSLLSAGLILGAKRGSGVVTCRTTAGWSAPAFITITGGSAGFQAGVQSADVVMLVMSDRGKEQLFRSSFELGADASAAAGPVGRDVQASTAPREASAFLDQVRKAFPSEEPDSAASAQRR